MVAGRSGSLERSSMSQTAKLEGQVSLRRSRMPSWDQIVTQQTAIRIGVIALLAAAAYWGELRRLFGEWIDKPDWTHGLLMPAISVWLVHINRDRLARIAAEPSIWGVPILLFASAMYLGGVVTMIGYPRAFSLPIMVLGAVVLMGGWQLARVVWFPIALFFFAIPLPSLWYTQTTFPLRELVAMLSTGTLNLLPDIHATRSATVVDYVYKGTTGTLNVEEACSGMRLLMAFLAMGAIMAYLMREKPLWHRVALLILCVPIAIFCNYLRVTITSLLYVYGFRTLAQGGSHTLLGLVMMVVALGLFGVANWMLSSLMVEESEPHAGEAA